MKIFGYEFKKATTEKVKPKRKYVRKKPPINLQEAMRIGTPKIIILNPDKRRRIGKKNLNCSYCLEPAVKFVKDKTCNIRNCGKPGCKAAWWREKRLRAKVTELKSLQKPLTPRPSNGA